jgi:dinuclear metal center YbgI/SA1388 family protein
LSSSSVPLRDIVDHLDHLLATADTPDYSGALNGLQVENRRPIARVAVAVDASLAAIDGAVAAGASLLIVHHGLFWSGAAPVRGATYERLSRLIENDVAVYSSHLPLDRHPELGNNALLARWLGLTPSLPFARFQSISVGVAGDADVPTADLARQLEDFAMEAGGRTTTIGVTEGRHTRRWALCTGAGASSETLREATQLGVDTLIVGEGPHHTGVEALDLGIAVIYAGHYATETLGVRALGRELEQVFGLPWTFIPAPTGL